MESQSQNININFKSRRISLGKTFSLEHCIKILENFFSSEEFDSEEFNIKVINHELPGEFRSTMWRIFLGILSSPYNKKNWISITKSYRQKFEKNFCDENFIKAVEFYSNKLEKKSDDSIKFQLDFEMENEFPSIEKELNLLKNDYDLFKSPSIQKSFLIIFLNWRLNFNSNLTKSLNPLAISFLSKIIGMLLYTLYPCMILNSSASEEISDNETDLKNIFYFLNLEDFLEHDISAILEKLISCSNLGEYILKFSENNLEHFMDLSIRELTGKEENFCELFEKKINLKENNFNLIEEISYRFLYGINKNTAKNLVAKGINLYDQVAKIYLSLMYEATKFENVGYYMDNILIYFSKERFNFVGCLIMSTFIHLEDDYVNMTKENCEKFLNSYPLLKFDPKEIIGKAMKIREKISDKFGN